MNSNIRSFTTIKNHNTLKPPRTVARRIRCFTTIKNHNTLKPHSHSRSWKTCFTTIKNHNTLKLQCPGYFEEKGFTTIKNHNTLKQVLTNKGKALRFTTIKNHNTLKLKLHFHASVLCKCIRLHRAARLLTVYHYSKIWHKSLSIMKRSSVSIVSWQEPSTRIKLRFSSLAFS